MTHIHPYDAEGYADQEPTTGLHPEIIQMFAMFDNASKVYPVRVLSCSGHVKGYFRNMDDAELYMDENA